MSTLQQVHVRVNDAATGKPTPCRVRFTDTEGRYYAPFGRLTEFATGYGVDVGGNVIADVKKYAYIDGHCEIALPPGKINIEVHKGPEYTPLLIENELTPGKLSLRYTLERWINLREEGWYSGDTRCHFLTPHAALLEGMAEDLAVVNLLAMECQIPETDDAGEKVIGQRWATPNLLAFSGQQPALEVPGHMVVVNTLNWHPWLGRLGLLNCHRVVNPLRFGAPGYDDWTLADWCDQCHRKGGFVVWTESTQRLVETLADAILGKVDALEIAAPQWYEFPYNTAWTWLASAGIVLPLVGTSAKVSNTQILGSTRTYAKLNQGENFDYKTWIDAARAGRTVVTKGPLLDLSVNGSGPGSAVNVTTAEPAVHIKVVAQCAELFHHLAVTYPGGRLAARYDGPRTRTVINETVQLQSSGLISAACYDSDDEHEIIAISTPIRVFVNGHQLPVDSHGTLEIPLMEIARKLENVGRFTNYAQRDRLTGIFNQARARLREARAT